MHRCNGINQVQSNIERGFQCSAACTFAAVIGALLGGGLPSLRPAHFQQIMPVATSDICPLLLRQMTNKLLQYFQSRNTVYLYCARSQLTSNATIACIDKVSTERKRNADRTSDAISFQYFCEVFNKTTFNR